jgi:hypothetical protein
MNRNWLTLGVVALLAIACDPYEATNEDPPSVVAVTATQTVDGDLVPASGAEVTPGVWNVEVPSVCTAGESAALQTALFVIFNKVMDGRTVQTYAETNESTPTAPKFEWFCDPFEGWLQTALTSGPAFPAGGQWYSCYNPSSAVPGEGASVVLYHAPTRDVSDPDPTNWVDFSTGWGDAEEIPSSTTIGTVYRFTGTIKDQQGRDYPLDVTMDIQPGIGDTGFDATAMTSTSVDLGWALPECNPDVTFQLFRCDAKTTACDSATQFTEIGAPLGTSTSYSDAGLTAGSIYVYELHSLVDTTPHAYDVLSGQVEYAILAQAAAPTFTATANSVTINWTAVEGAEGYQVQRAGDDGAGAPDGNWITITSTTTALTTTDEAVLPSTPYWYRIVPTSNDVNGLPVAGFEPGVEATVTTPAP